MGSIPKKSIFEFSKKLLILTTVLKSIFRTVLSWFSYFLQSGKLQETFIKIWG